MLYLQMNEIEMLPGDVFSCLSQLFYLDLSSNKLSSLANTSLAGLSGLQTLSLSNNHLAGLERLYLDDLSELMVVKLETNQVETFSGSVLDSLPRLSQLYLDDNPLQCDCRLIDLLAWSGRPGNFLSGAICYSPPSLSGRKLTQLSEDDLICISPRIDYYSDDVIAMAGTMVELFCNASGQPEPIITWSTPRGRYIPPNHDKGEKFTTYENGILVISDVDYTDDGKYTCRAANIEGDTSVAIALTVIGRISSTPETTPEGSPIAPVSQCDATGQILGTFFGTFFGTLLLCALLFYVWFSRQNKKKQNFNCEVFNNLGVPSTVRSSPSTSPIANRQGNPESQRDVSPASTAHANQLVTFPLQTEKTENIRQNNTDNPAIKVIPEYFEIIPDDNPTIPPTTRNSAPAGTCNPGYDYAYEVPERERRYTALVKDEEAIYQTLYDHQANV
uniref:Peroxidasin homolog n=1 Tax=Saccoglossus kowalevskii TaxID=10224 RepID=A0ABM0M6Q5_SACKO|nr:PREDICTED: peroxidasin homolog [Saccoglossus kowalevskii]